MPVLPVHVGKKKRAAWKGHSGRMKRITGRALGSLRLALYVREGGKCRNCGLAYRLSQMIRDHIIPDAEGGLDVESNTQLLCVDCHVKKTAAESQRGSARWR